MNLMAILLGMAVGGLVMSSLRATAVLVISALVFGVTFEVQQWGLVIVVFLLTMSALYGLGMMLASLFLLWGREAFHMTNVLIEPVYFVSGLNFPVGRLGALGAVAIATIPFAVGLDAMRQLVFAGQPYITGTPSPEVEALILVAMTVVFSLLARVMIRQHRADGPVPRQPLDPLAVSAPEAPPASAGFDPVRRRGRRPGRHGPQPADLDAPRLAGGVQLDRPHAVPHLHRRAAGLRRCCCWS